MAKFNVKVKKDLIKIAKKTNDAFNHASHDCQLYKKENKKPKNPLDDDENDLSEIFDISED